MGTPDQDLVRAMTPAAVVGDVSSIATVTRSNSQILPVYKRLDFRLYFSDPSATPPNALRILTTCPVSGMTDELASDIIPADELTAVTAVMSRASKMIRLRAAAGTVSK